jgi:hypothetical protein
VVFSNKTDNLTEILFRVAFNTINQTKPWLLAFEQWFYFGYSTFFYNHPMCWSSKYCGWLNTGTGRVKKKHLIINILSMWTFVLIITIKEYYNMKKVAHIMTRLFCSTECRSSLAFRLSEVARYELHALSCTRSERLFLNANWAIFQLYHYCGENNVMMMPTL